MPADLADSLEADEEDRKTDHAPLVQVKDNEEVAICDGGDRDEPPAGRLRDRGGRHEGRSHRLREPPLGESTWHRQTDSIRPGPH